MVLQQVTVALLVASVLWPTTVRASYAAEPLKTTVASSDLIVVGTLTAVRARVPRVGIAEHEGTIAVEEHLAGDPVKDRRCTLLWSRGRIPSGGIDHKARLNQRGIWLLHRSGAGRYAADYPARFQPIAERAKVMELIRSPLFLLDTSGWSDGGKASSLRFVIRTFLPRLEVRDYLSLDRGKLQLHGRARVEVQGQIGDPIAALPGKIVRAKGPAIVVTRDQPHLVQIDLRRHFALAGRKGKPGREVFHLHWGTGPDDRSPSYSFELD